MKNNTKKSLLCALYLILGSVISLNSYAGDVDGYTALEIEDLLGDTLLEELSPRRLTATSPEVFAELSPTTLNLLQPEDVAILSIDQLRAIGPNNFGKLISGLIQRILPKKLSTLFEYPEFASDAELISYLRSEGIEPYVGYSLAELTTQLAEALEYENVELNIHRLILTDAGVIDQLSAAQLLDFGQDNFAILSADQLKAISPNDLMTLPSEFYVALGEDKLQALFNDSSFDPNSKFLEYLYSLNLDFVQGYTAAQIRTIINDESLTLDAQPLSLTGADVIRELTAVDLASFSSDEVALLTVRQLLAIDPGILADEIPISFYDALSEPKLIELFSHSAFYANYSLLDHLARSNVNFLPVDALKELPTESAAAYLRNANIQDMTEERFSAFNKFALNFVTDDQLRALPVALLDVLSNIDLSKLTYNTLLNLNSEYLGALTTAQVRSFPLAALGNLKKELENGESDTDNLASKLSTTVHADIKSLDFIDTTKFSEDFNTLGWEFEFFSVFLLSDQSFGLGKGLVIAENDHWQMTVDFRVRRYREEHKARLEKVFRPVVASKLDISLEEVTDEDIEKEAGVNYSESERGLVAHTPIIELVSKPLSLHQQTDALWLEHGKSLELFKQALRDFADLQHKSWNQLLTLDDFLQTYNRLVTSEALTESYKLEANKVLSISESYGIPLFFQQDPEFAKTLLNPIAGVQMTFQLPHSWGDNYGSNVKESYSYKMPNVSPELGHLFEQHGLSSLISKSLVHMVLFDYWHGYVVNKGKTILQTLDRSAFDAVLYGIDLHELESAYKFLQDPANIKLLAEWNFNYILSEKEREKTSVNRSAVVIKDIANVVSNIFRERMSHGRIYPIDYVGYGKISTKGNEFLSVPNSFHPLSMQFHHYPLVYSSNVKQSFALIEFRDIDATVGLLLNFIKKRLINIDKKDGTPVSYEELQQARGENLFFKYLKYPKRLYTYQNIKGETLTFQPYEKLSRVFSLNYSSALGETSNVENKSQALLEAYRKLTAKDLIRRAAIDARLGKILRAHIAENLITNKYIAGDWSFADVKAFQKQLTAVEREAWLMNRAEVGGVDLVQLSASNLLFNITTDGVTYEFYYNEELGLIIKPQGVEPTHITVAAHGVLAKDANRNAIPVTIENGHEVYYWSEYGKPTLRYPGMVYEVDPALSVPALRRNYPERYLLPITGGQDFYDRQVKHLENISAEKHQQLQAVLNVLYGTEEVILPDSMELINPDLIRAQGDNEAFYLPLKEALFELLTKPASEAVILPTERSNRYLSPAGVNLDSVDGSALKAYQMQYRNPESVPMVIYLTKQQKQSQALRRISALDFKDDLGLTKPIRKISFTACSCAQEGEEAPALSDDFELAKYQDLTPSSVFTSYEAIAATSAEESVASVPIYQDQADAISITESLPVINENYQQATASDRYEYQDVLLEQREGERTLIEQQLEKLPVHEELESEFKEQIAGPKDSVSDVSSWWKKTEELARSLTNQLVKGVDKVKALLSDFMGAKQSKAMVERSGFERNNNTADQLSKKWIEARHKVDELRAQLKQDMVKNNLDPETWTPLLDFSQQVEPTEQTGHYSYRVIFFNTETHEHITTFVDNDVYLKYKESFQEVESLRRVLIQYNSALPEAKEQIVEANLSTLNAGMFAMMLSHVATQHTGSKSVMEKLYGKSLYLGLQIQTYMNLAVLGGGQVLEVATYVSQVSAALNTGKIAATSLKVASVAGKTNAAIGGAVALFNLVFDSYVLSTTDNPYLKTRYAVAVAFDTLNAGLFIGSIAAQISTIVAESIVGEILGPAGALVGGLAVGIMGLVEAFQSVQKDVDNMARMFNRFDVYNKDNGDNWDSDSDSWKYAGYEFDSSSKTLKPLSYSATKKLDLPNLTITPRESYIQAAATHLDNGDKYPDSCYGHTGSVPLSCGSYPHARDGDVTYGDADKGIAIIKKTMGEESARFPLKSGQKIENVILGFSEAYWYNEYDWSTTPSNADGDIPGKSILDNLESGKRDSWFLYTMDMGASHHVMWTMEQHIIPAQDVEIILNRDVKNVVYQDLSGAKIGKVTLSDAMQENYNKLAKTARYVIYADDKQDPVTGEVEPYRIVLSNHYPKLRLDKQDHVEKVTWVLDTSEVKLKTHIQGSGIQLIDEGVVINDQHIVINGWDQDTQVLIGIEGELWEVDRRHQQLVARSEDAGAALVRWLAKKEAVKLLLAHNYSFLPDDLSTTYVSYIGLPEDDHYGLGDRRHDLLNTRIPDLCTQASPASLSMQANCRIYLEQVVESTIDDYEYKIRDGHEAHGDSDADNTKGELYDQYKKYAKKDDETALVDFFEQEDEIDSGLLTPVAKGIIDEGDLATIMVQTNYRTLKEEIDTDLFKFDGYGTIEISLDGDKSILLEDMPDNIHSYYLDMDTGNKIFLPTDTDNASIEYLGNIKDDYYYYNATIGNIVIANDRGEESHSIHLGHSDQARILARHVQGEYVYVDVLMPRTDLGIPWMSAPLDLAKQFSQGDAVFRYQVSNQGATLVQINNQLALSSYLGLSHYVQETENLEVGILQSASNYQDFITQVAQVEMSDSQDQEHASLAKRIKVSGIAHALGSYRPSQYWLIAQELDGDDESTDTERKTFVVSHPVDYSSVRALQDSCSYYHEEVDHLLSSWQSASGVDAAYKAKQEFKLNQLMYHACAYNPDRLSEDDQLLYYDVESDVQYMYSPLYSKIYLLKTPSFEQHLETIESQLDQDVDHTFTGVDFVSLEDDSEPSQRVIEDLESLERAEDPQYLFGILQNVKEVLIQVHVDDWEGSINLPRGVPSGREVVLVLIDGENSRLTIHDNQYKWNFVQGSASVRWTYDVDAWKTQSYIIDDDEDLKALENNPERLTEYLDLYPTIVIKTSDDHWTGNITLSEYTLSGRKVVLVVDSSSTVHVNDDTHQTTLKKGERRAWVYDAEKGWTAPYYEIHKNRDLRALKDAPDALAAYFERYPSVTIRTSDGNWVESMTLPEAAEEGTQLGVVVNSDWGVWVHDTHHSVKLNQGESRVWEYVQGAWHVNHYLLNKAIQISELDSDEEALLQYLEYAPSMTVKTYDGAWVKNIKLPSTAPEGAIFELIVGSTYAVNLDYSEDSMTLSKGQSKSWQFNQGTWEDNTAEIVPNKRIIVTEAASGETDSDSALQADNTASLLQESSELSPVTIGEVAELLLEHVEKLTPTSVDNEFLYTDQDKRVWLLTLSEEVVSGSHTADGTRVNSKDKPITTYYSQTLMGLSLPEQISDQKTAYQWIRNQIPDIDYENSFVVHGFKNQDKQNLWAWVSEYEEDQHVIVLFDPSIHGVSHQAQVELLGLNHAKGIGYIQVGEGNQSELYQVAVDLLPDGVVESMGFVVGAYVDRDVRGVVIDRQITSKQIDTYEPTIGHSTSYTVKGDNLYATYQMTGEDIYNVTLSYDDDQIIIERYQAITEDIEQASGHIMELLHDSRMTTSHAVEISGVTDILGWLIRETEGDVTYNIVQAPNLVDAKNPPSDPQWRLLGTRIADTGMTYDKADEINVAWTSYVKTPIETERVALLFNDGDETGLYTIDYNGNIADQNTFYQDAIRLEDSLNVKLVSMARASQLELTLPWIDGVTSLSISRGDGQDTATLSDGTQKEVRTRDDHVYTISEKAWEQYSTIYLDAQYMLGQGAGAFNSGLNIVVNAPVESLQVERIVGGFEALDTQTNKNIKLIGRAEQAQVLLDYTQIRYTLENVILMHPLFALFELDTDECSWKNENVDMNGDSMADVVCIVTTGTHPEVKVYIYDVEQEQYSEPEVFAYPDLGSTSSWMWGETDKERGIYSFSGKRAWFCRAKSVNNQDWSLCNEITQEGLIAKTSMDPRACFASSSQSCLTSPTDSENTIGSASFYEIYRSHIEKMYERTWGMLYASDFNPENTLELYYGFSDTQVGCVADETDECMWQGTLNNIMSQYDHIKPCDGRSIGSMCQKHGDDYEFSLIQSFDINKDKVWRFEDNVLYYYGNGMIGCFISDSEQNSCTPVYSRWSQLYYQDEEGSEEQIYLRNLALSKLVCNPNNSNYEGILVGEKHDCELLGNMQIFDEILPPSDTEGRDSL